MTESTGDPRNTLTLDLALEASSLDEMKRLLLFLAENLDALEKHSGKSDALLLDDSGYQH